MYRCGEREIKNILIARPSVFCNCPNSLGKKIANTLKLEDITLKLEDITLKLKDITLKLEDITLKLEDITLKLENSTNS